MSLKKLPAVFMRGGTSKALMFHQQDLPAERSQWDAIFLAAIGSPDPHGRQLDGMGGGVSSLSKVCVIAPPTRPDADVDYVRASGGERGPRRLQRHRGLFDGGDDLQGAVARSGRVVQSAHAGAHGPSREVVRDPA